MSEIFKRNARDKELKLALGHRKEREEERDKVKQRLRNEFKQLPDKMSYHASLSERMDKDDGETDNISISIHGEGDEEENNFIRDVASKVLQARWRIMRFVPKTRIF